MLVMVLGVLIIDHIEYKISFHLGDVQKESSGLLQDLPLKMKRNKWYHCQNDFYFIYSIFECQLTIPLKKV